MDNKEQLYGVQFNEATKQFHYYPHEEGAHFIGDGWHDTQATISQGLIPAWEQFVSDRVLIDQMRGGEVAILITHWKMYMQTGGVTHMLSMRRFINGYSDMKHVAWVDMEKGIRPEDVNAVKK